MPTKHSEILDKIGIVITDRNVSRVSDLSANHNRIIKFSAGTVAKARTIGKMNEETKEVPNPPKTVSVEKNAEHFAKTLTMKEITQVKDGKNKPAMLPGQFLSNVKKNSALLADAMGVGEEENTVEIPISINAEEVQEKINRSFEDNEVSLQDRTEEIEIPEVEETIPKVLPASRRFRKREVEEENMELNEEKSFSVDDMTNDIEATAEEPRVVIEDTVVPEEEKVAESEELDDELATFSAEIRRLEDQKSELEKGIIDYSNARAAAIKEYETANRIYHESMKELNDTMREVERTGQEASSSKKEGINAIESAKKFLMERRNKLKEEIKVQEKRQEDIITQTHEIRNQIKETNNGTAELNNKIPGCQMKIAENKNEIEIWNRKREAAKSLLEEDIKSGITPEVQEEQQAEEKPEEQSQPNIFNFQEEKQAIDENPSFDSISDYLNMLNNYEETEEKPRSRKVA